MTDPINDLAADIREADGNYDLGAGQLAEKLIEMGWVKPNPDAEPEYPRLEGEIIALGPEIFADAGGKVVSWKGQNYVPQAASEQTVPLKDYQLDDKVTVLKNGDWLEGIVYERDKVSNHLHVNTERGPVTIATPRFIKRA